MLKVLKWFIYSVLILVLLLILSLELFYHYRVHQSKPQLFPIQQQFSLSAKEMLWVETNEIGNFELEKLTVTEYAFRIIHYALTPIQNRSFRNQLIPIKGLQLTMMASRLVSVDEEVSERSKNHLSNYRINQIIKTVWLTRNTTIDELLEYVLENAYFGTRELGLQNASKHYFGKPSVDLTRHELISLISPLKGFSYYHPLRYPKRFKKRAKVITGRLKENWPEKYGDYNFIPPGFLEQLKKPKN